MNSEITVILKDPERTYRQKFLIYSEYTVSEHDPIILDCIQNALKNFEGDPETIQVKIHIEVQ